MPILSKSDHDIVTSAVTAAEQITSGEIVTVVTDQSDGYTDVALAIAAAFAFAVMALASIAAEPLLEALASLSGAWNADWSVEAIFAIATGIGTLAFLLALLLQAIPAVRFAMIPGRIKTQRAEDRAIDLFKVGAERRTHGRTGVLVYLSMREHRAEIVADAPIAEKVAPEVWGEAMADMLAEIKQGRIADGMAAGVRDVGLILSEHFPRADDDENELPDRLIEV